MIYKTVTEVGVDLIALPVTLFTIGYWFFPWRDNHFGKALMAHAVGTMILADLAVLTQYGVVAEQYPGHQVVTLLILGLWIVGWWYMVFALGPYLVTKFKGWRSRDRRN